MAGGRDRREHRLGGGRRGGGGRRRRGHRALPNGDAVPRHGRTRRPRTSSSRSTSRAVAAAGGRPVIVRTLDVGGDKPLPYLALPKEDNPFLGYRAVRIYPRVRGALPLAGPRARAGVGVRAAAGDDPDGLVRSTRCAGCARSSRTSSAASQRPAWRSTPAMPVGAMIEVPSAAFLIGPLRRELDFFSIGTNDLLQYFLAADRANPRVAALANPLEPSFLRLLDRIVSEAHARGRWVGLCGEMGGQARLPAGAGRSRLRRAQRGAAGDCRDEGPAQPACRPPRAARWWSAPLTRHGPRRRAACSTSARHWRAAAADRPRTGPRPRGLPHEGRGDQGGVDLLYGAGRTDRPRDVEEAVWRREADYSTGFGHGFAIPHCKTDAVDANSMAVVKLRARRGVGRARRRSRSARSCCWPSASPTRRPRTCSVLASLARQLMHEEFRVEGGTGAGPGGALPAAARHDGRVGSGLTPRLRSECPERAERVEGQGLRLRAHGSGASARIRSGRSPGRRRGRAGDSRR